MFIYLPILFYNFIWCEVVKCWDTKHMFKTSMHPLYYICKLLCYKRTDRQTQNLQTLHTCRAHSDSPQLVLGFSSGI